MTDSSAYDRMVFFFIYYFTCNMNYSKGLRDAANKFLVNIKNNINNFDEKRSYLSFGISHHESGNQ